MLPMSEQIDLDFDTVDLEFDPPHKEESTEPPAEVVITPEVKHTYLLTLNENELDGINNALPVLRELGIVPKDESLDQFMDECFARGLKEICMEGLCELSKP